MLFPRTKTYLGIFSTFAVLLGAGSAQDTPIVDVGYAQYQGTFNSSSNATNFLGIRYAAPPTGDLRWRAPSPPANITGVQQANTQPNQCFQGATGANRTNPFPRSLEKRAVESSEDCLFLNVHVPGSTIPESGLPTIVWIHGGGYVAGQASTFDGQDLIRESNHSLVVVVIQYRLALFGFLPGSEIKANGSLNAGLLDQDFALQWVNAHIAGFGGDPDQVTIWGESAGAGSVLQHIVAHDGQTQPPLFRGAITSSTFLPSQYIFNDSVPEFLYSETVQMANCSDASDTLACLRETDVNALQQVDSAISLSGFFGTFVWVPVVDGDFITQRVTEALAQKKVNGDVLLAVTNTFEGTIFVNANFTGNATEYSQLLFPHFSEEQSATVANLYAGIGSNLDQAIAIQGESIFICPTYFLLDAFNDTSFKGLYAVPPGEHGQDVNYYFPSRGSVTFPNPAFVSAFDTSFTSFIVSLNPNNDFVPSSWPMYFPDRTEMVFNRTEAGEPNIFTTETDSTLLARCGFWESVGASTGQ